MKKRRKFTAAFKAKVALEAIRGVRSASEVGSRYGIHPTQVQLWKKQAIEALPEVFAEGRSRGEKSDEALQARLYAQIGKLQVELDWLKKNDGV